MVDYPTIAIILSTLLGPVFAVQAQKWLEQNREQKDRRLQIFRTLMQTRSSTTSPLHVEALNSIPVEFYGKSKKQRAVVTAWRDLLHHLSFGDPNQDIWHLKHKDLLIDLLGALAKCLNYDFARVELQRDIYFPVAHQRLEERQAIISDGLAKLLVGEACLNVRLFATELSANDTVGVEPILSKGT